MLRINKKTEYALLAIEHMCLLEAEGAKLSNTREISETYHIPHPLLAKIMQKLANKGFIKSVHGTKGGYLLAKRPHDMSVADILAVFEGPLAVADCFKEAKIDCPQWDGCTIKDPFYELNHKIHELLTQTTIADLAKKKGPVQSKEGIKV